MENDFVKLLALDDLVYIENYQSSLEYDNFKEIPSTGNCLTLNENGIWDYVNCNNENHFICKKLGKIYTF